MTVSREELGKLKPITPEDDERLRKEAIHEYNEEHKEGKKEYMQKYREENKEGLKEYDRQRNKYHKKHYQENKEEISEYMAKNERTEKGKAIRKEANSRRRGLGFLELNEPFEDSEAHHINENTIVYIPKKLHKSIYHNLKTGQGMVEINNKVVEWLIEIGELMPMPR